MDTRSPEYARRLERSVSSRWRRLLQAPYRWNLRRLDLGFTLDVGCGVGRNLAALDGVGIDHNPMAVESARRRGLVAFTSEEFADSDYARSDRFDSMLLAHVVEHMTGAEASALIARYLPLVRAGGSVVLIAPQEAGFRCDETHVEFVDPSGLSALLAGKDVEVVREFSFPFPRFAGRLFPYNEFVTVGRRS